MENKILKNVAGGMVAAVMVFGANQANALTYDVGMGSLLVHVSDPGNDPSPDNLVCSSATGQCGGPGETGTVANFFNNVVDINSAALAKYNVPDTDPGGWVIDAVNFDITFDDSKNGTWSQTIVAGALLTHYVVVKASTEWLIFEIVLPPVLNVGDVLTGSWSSAFDLLGQTGGRDLSHLSLYNSIPGPPQQAIPLPAAFPLFASGLGVLGLLGWRRRRKAAV